MYTGTDTAVPIPVTTRGIGIHAAMFYNHYKMYGCNDNIECTASQLYRVSLIQLDVKMQINCRENLILDSDVEITTPLAYFGSFNDISAEPNNFTLIAQAINSLGNFGLDDIDYQPYIPEMDEVDLVDNADKTSEASSRFFDCDEWFDTAPMRGDKFERTGSPSHNIEIKKRIVPSPYLVTIHNLRQVVLALSNPMTPLKERQNFIHRNPIPSAIFYNDLLTNPDEIMPENYDIDIASSDILAFRKMLFQMSSLFINSVQSIQYRHHGDISILSCVHHPFKEKFSLQKGSLVYTNQSIVRSFGPKDGTVKFNGSVYLMSEYPDVGLDNNHSANWSKWSIRSPYLSNSAYQTPWLTAVTNLFYPPNTSSMTFDLNNVPTKKDFEL